MVASPLVDLESVKRSLATATAAEVDAMRKAWTQKLAEYEIFEEHGNAMLAREAIVLIAAKATGERVARQFQVDVRGSVVRFQSTMTDSEAAATIRAKIPHDDFAMKLAGLTRRTETQLAWLHKKAMDAVTAPPASNWVGMVGDKFELPVKVVSLRERMGRRGPQTIVKMVTQEGNELTWFADGVPAIQPNTTITIEARVKAHDTFQGRKVTIITRVSPK